MELKESLEKRKFIITSEIYLPQGRTPEEYLSELYNLWGRIDGVRYHPFAADAAVSDSLALCRLLRERKFDPVFEVMTRDRNRLEIQDALIHASSAGVENLLVFSEDYRVTGDSLQEMMFFQVDMGKFFSVIENLQRGTDVHGKDLDGEKDFFIGSGVDASAGGRAPDLEIREMEQLAERGTKYFLTTPVFDIDQFAAFVKRVAPLRIPVVAEIMMLQSGMQARMLKRYGGIYIPDHLIERIERAPVKFDESAKIMLEMINSIKDICAGVHIIPFGWEGKIGKILQEIRRWR
ncbi:MAG: methylenetetrahydrofolate reductase [Desulfomonile sp.]|jgi:5,10-methylenetetrahydrofolate reductase|nr:methylenetetrahydrofolate reductase [Deltaproteobacteria bacterium]